MRHSIWLAVPLLLACDRGKIELGAGPETDARWASDAYTWDCAQEDAQWMGVLGFDVSLEFAADQLDARPLPAPGDCEYGISMFALDNPTSGDALPDGDDVGWQTESQQGSLDEVTQGLWYSDIFHNVLSCQRVDQIITDGVELTEAGILTGAKTPEAGDVTAVIVDSEYQSGIPFGTEVGLQWDVSGWEDTFVQVRRVRDDVALESVTCNTAGLDSFTVDAEIWDEFDSNLGVDLNYIYVGFQNESSVTSDEGRQVDALTRALHVVGVVEI